MLEAHHPLRCQNHGHADRPAMAHRIRKVLWRESPCRGVEKLGNARLVKHMLFLRNKLISFFLQCSFTTPGFDFDGGKGIRHRCFRIIGQRLHRIHIRSDALAGQWLLLT